MKKKNSQKEINKSLLATGIAFLGVFLVFSLVSLFQEELMFSPSESSGIQNLDVMILIFVGILGAALISISILRSFFDKINKTVARASIKETSQK